MKAQQMDIARKCLNGADDKTMDFPGIVMALIEAGFESYTVDFRSRTTTYFLPDGESLALENRPSQEPIAAAFDPAGIATQIRWAQQNPADYTYAAFCRHVKAAGCAGYMVSFPGRRAVYYGRTAETHVEHFPD